MQRMVETTVTPFKADIVAAAFNLFEGALGLKHQSRTVLRQTYVLDAKTGQIEFQDYLIAGFVHVHQRMVNPFAKDSAKFKGTQKIANIAQVPIEEFLP